MTCSTNNTCVPIFSCLDSIRPADFIKNLCTEDSVCCKERIIDENPKSVGGKLQRNSSTWSDLFFSQSGPITSFRMWFSSKIEAVQFKYGDVWADRHGSVKGHQIKYDLDSNSKIISAQVYIYYYKRLNCLNKLR